MTCSKLLTPALLVLFVCASLTNISLGIGLICLCGISSLLWQWGPAWLETLGLLCVLAICFYNRPVQVTCVFLLLAVLWWQSAPRD